MNQEPITRFLATATLKLPALIKSRLENKARRELYDDYALLSFELPQPLSVDRLQDVIDDSFGTTLLYHHARSVDTDFGQTVCAFQEPGTGEMFQICGTTNSRGVIAAVDVKIYNSLERMMAELRNELLRVANSPGVFLYALREDELLSYFI